MLITACILLIILLVILVVCSIVSNGFEAYSSIFPLPLISNKWGRVKAGGVDYPESTPMNKLKQLEDDGNHIDKKLFKSNRSKNYSKMGIWPDSSAPPKLSNGFIQNIYLKNIGIKNPDHKTTCFTQSPLTVEKVMEPRPNQYELSFN